jgi:retron-type reverse transcriptase
LVKVAQRVEDDDVMHLLKIMLKANGRHGVPQGGVVSPLLSNIYLNEVDRMLERAKEATRHGKYTGILSADLILDQNHRFNLLRCAFRHCRFDVARLRKSWRLQSPS